MTERTWVQKLVPRLQQEFQRFRPAGVKVMVSDGTRLAYTCVIHEYEETGGNEPDSDKYETDLLFSDALPDGSWIPRVVVECKIGRVTTHDALTYSSKAAAHKHVHPYLRYGFLAGERKHYAIPARLVKHGAHFDFMATWSGAQPTKGEFREFCRLVKQEIKASRRLQAVFMTNRSAARKKYSILHRRLVLK